MPDPTAVSAWQILLGLVVIALPVVGILISVLIHDWWLKRQPVAAEEEEVAPTTTTPPSIIDIVPPLPPPSSVRRTIYP